MLSRDGTYFFKLRRNPSKCVKYNLKNNSSAARNPEVKQFCIIAMNDDEFRWKLASDSVHLVLKRARCISLHSNGRYGSALTGVSGRKNRNNQVIMADACSLSKKGLLDCGSSRGRAETMFLYEYRDDVTTHLKGCFLSRANLKEYEVILQGAGLDRLCSSSLWYGQVLEAFKVVSVSRAQRTTYQRQKSWRDQPCHGQGGVSVVWHICTDRPT